MMERWHKVRNFLNNGRNQTTGEVVYGRYLQDLPSHKIAEIEKSAQAAFCAPHKCLEEVHSSVKKRLNKNTEEPQEPIFENVFDWSQGKEYADGLVTSLYERSTKDGQKKYMGDPIADSLAVVTRRNSAILALADGVSWGQKSRLAATCGIYGSVKYLNDNLANCKTTKDVFNQILKGFEQAQNCIVSEQGTMTTLCVAVVVPMPEKERYGLCVVNVGDSYAYVFNKHYGVKEVTEGSHPINEVRDMRNSGGALGPADGYNPDLSNLTCSFIIIEKGDLVFLCSDGISDNFDPVIAKHSPPRMEVKSLPSSFEASTELSKKEFRKQKTESFEELDNAPDIHVESVREESICASCLKQSAESPVETKEKQNSLDFLPKVNVDELIAMKNKRNSPEHFQDVMNTDDNAKRKSPEIFTDPLRKTSPAISDLFPAYDKTKPNKPNLQKTDSIKIPVCQKCGKALRRITEWALPYLGDRRSSVLDCLPKLSESTSMDRISEEKKTSAEETRGKSRSFTNSNDAPSPHSGAG
uniref:PPM-type phosphatase domain-containing protein n=1 Tax=Clytia hemisphaerica TaxID=252671 RepID=A0A7M5X3K8_9CNID